MTRPPEPAGSVSEALTFVRPGLTVSLEYSSETFFPRRRTVQEGWKEGKLEVDGRDADLVSYTPVEPEFADGRTMFVGVRLPDRPGNSTAPGARGGMEFEATIQCAGTAECETALRIIRTIRFADS